jgi:hypothetical protein
MLDVSQDMQMVALGGRWWPGPHPYYVESKPGLLKKWQH